MSKANFYPILGFIYRIAKHVYERTHNEESLTQYLAAFILRSTLIPIHADATILDTGASQNNVKHTYSQQPQFEVGSATRKYVKNYLRLPFFFLRKSFKSYGRGSGGLVMGHPIYVYKPIAL